MNYTIITWRIVRLVKSTTQAVDTLRFAYLVVAYTYFVFHGENDMTI